jgi:hypothetical protein
MWRVESGVSEGDSEMDDLVVHILINIDPNGKELQRAGNFANIEDANQVASALNQTNVHSATVIANYLGTRDYLEEFVRQQEVLNVWLDSLGTEL